MPRYKISFEVEVSDSAESDELSVEDDMTRVLGGIFPTGELGGIADIHGYTVRVDEVNQ